MIACLAQRLHRMAWSLRLLDDTSYRQAFNYLLTHLPAASYAEPFLEMNRVPQPRHYFLPLALIHFFPNSFSLLRPLVNGFFTHQKALPLTQAAEKKTQDKVCRTSSGKPEHSLDDHISINFMAGSAVFVEGSSSASYFALYKSALTDSIQRTQFGYNTTGYHHTVTRSHRREQEMKLQHSGREPHASFCLVVKRTHTYIHAYIRSAASVPCLHIWKMMVCKFR